MRFLKRLFNFPTKDPDDARRRGLLNVLLVGVAVMSLLGILAAAIADISGAVPHEEIMGSLIYQGGVIALLGMAIIFLINRFVSGQLASSLFLLLLTAIFALADEPEQVIEGRSLFLFAIPILMASVTLRPWASFVAAGISNLILTLIALSLPGYVPPVPTMLGFFAIALVAWLAARNLENALVELRIINEELDHRVEERTRELTEANQRLADANDRLQELDRLKSRFVSMVSHELRTPLNAIQGFTEMLGAGVYGDITPPQQGALERITVNTQRLLGIVNDLLDQARIEAGQLSLHFEEFSPNELVDDLHSTMVVLAEAKNLNLNTAVAPNTPPTLYGDQQRLHQILVNLVNNAFKFTEQGGVTVRIYRPDATHWAMEVSDTGPGIPQQAQEYIFEAFRQADGSATREHKGAGLGLAIVKQLTELMGGTITLESIMGQGSTFTVLLPLITSEEVIL